MKMLCWKDFEDATLDPSFFSQASSLNFFYAPVQLSDNCLVNSTLMNELLFFSSICHASFRSKSTELSGTYELISILFAVV